MNSIYHAAIIISSLAFFLASILFLKNIFYDGIFSLFQRRKNEPDLGFSLPKPINKWDPSGLRDLELDTPGRDIIIPLPAKKDPSDLPPHVCDCCLGHQLMHEDLKEMLIKYRHFIDTQSEQVALTMSQLEDIMGHYTSFKKEFLEFLKLKKEQLHRETLYEAKTVKLPQGFE